jgi:CDGSH-type Zn-finger protein
LTYSDKSGAEEQPVPVNSVNVSYNGPLFALGDLDIKGAPEEMPGIRFRAALCRCGKSGNKPFCDNSHLEAGFEDYGAIGERGDVTETSGGKLTITPAANGPLILSGNVTLFTGSGRAAWKGDKVALCRCGASKNKPFCDGSHKEVGFTSD